VGHTSRGAFAAVDKGISRGCFRKAIAPAGSLARQRFPRRAEVKGDSVIVNSGMGFDERGDSLWCD